MGHEGSRDRGKEIGDIYSKLKERIAFRKKWAEQLGLGFEIPAKNISIGRFNEWLAHT